MSIANLKDTGNQGNNMPWQWNVLKGLQALLDQNTACCNKVDVALGAIIDLINPQERTATVTSTIGSGATLDGLYSVSIANVGSTSGFVNGTSIPAGVTLNFDAGVLNNTLRSIAYDANGSTFIITTIGSV
jgi:hypothetical protein